MSVAVFINVSRVTVKERLVSLFPQDQKGMYEQSK